eukprot:scaffold22191_cov128-Isochrysis_galbana.AAC.5
MLIAFPLFIWSDSGRIDKKTTKETPIADADAALTEDEECGSHTHTHVQVQALRRWHRSPQRTRHIWHAGGPRKHWGRWDYSPRAHPSRPGRVRNR